MCLLGKIESYIIQLENRNDRFSSGNFFEKIYIVLLEWVSVTNDGICNSGICIVENSSFLEKFSLFKSHINTSVVEKSNKFIYNDITFLYIIILFNNLSDLFHSVYSFIILFFLSSF